MNYCLLYLDPGSGSFMLQALIGVVLAAGVFFKSIRYRVTSFFTKSKKENNNENNPEQ